MFIDHKISSFYGRVRADAPTPLVIPTDPAAALVFASRIDREADHMLADGRCIRAEQLSHLALEARCRATGARA